MADPRPETGPKPRSADELLRPDPRSANFVQLNTKTGEVRHMRIEDGEELLLRIEQHLTPAVPEQIRKRMAVAHDLIVYAWFCYDFFTVSAAWSLGTAEMALRTKFEELNPPPSKVKLKGNLRSLLDWAVNENIFPDGISSDAVRHLRNAMAHPKEINTVYSPGMAVDIFGAMVRIVASLWSPSPNFARNLCSGV